MSRNFLGRRVQICGKSETESETVICVRALIKGKKAFRIGLAKFKKDHKDVPWLMKKFVGTLLDRGMITIEGTLEKPVCSFAGTIPISGALRCVFKNNVQKRMIFAIISSYVLFYHYTRAIGCRQINNCQKIGKDFTC